MTAKMEKRVPPSLLTRKSTLLMSVLAEAAEVSHLGSHNAIPKTVLTQHILNAIGEEHIVVNEVSFFKSTRL